MLLEVHPISPDLAPQVFEADVGLSLLRVMGRESSAKDGVESGVVKAVVVSALRPDVPAAGAAVTFAFARDDDEQQRLRHGANTWNTLRLEAEDHLLAAWVAADASRGILTLRAAESVAGADDPSSGELREAVATHAIADAAMRKARLAKALERGKGVLRRYACAAVGPRKLVTRAEGVEMLRDAIASPRTGPRDDIALAGTLCDGPLFDASHGPDRANAIALTTLARNLVAVEPAGASMWLRYLCSAVMPELDADAAEDWNKRKALLRSIDVPRKALDERLGVVSRMPGPDTPLALELQEAWAKAWKD